MPDKDGIRTIGNLQAPPPPHGVEDGSLVERGVPVENVSQIFPGKEDAPDRLPKEEVSEITPSPTYETLYGDENNRDKSPEQDENIPSISPQPKPLKTPIGEIEGLQNVPYNKDKISTLAQQEEDGFIEGVEAAQHDYRTN